MDVHGTHGPRRGIALSAITTSQRLDLDLQVWHTRVTTSALTLIGTSLVVLWVKSKGDGWSSRHWAGPSGFGLSVRMVACCCVFVCWLTFVNE